MYNIIIDGSADPSFGSDQAYISYPTVFPTVGFQLVPTDDLVSAAKSLLSDAGSDPFEEYEFYLGINGFTKSGVDNSIVAIAPDDTTVSIYLDETEQEKVFALLNKECLEKYGKGCDALLEAAHCQMRDADVSFSLEEE